MIDTPRLLLRFFQTRDLADFYEYCKIKGVGEAAGWPHHQSSEESAQILARFVNTPEEYALVLKAENKVIGSIGLHQGNYPQGEKEIGYVLSQDYWKQGLMSEAVAAMIEYVFTSTSLQTLWVSHQVGNKNSKRVIEKNNFVFQYEKERLMPLLGVTRLSRYYSLSREGYQQTKK